MGPIKRNLLLSILVALPVLARADDRNAARAHYLKGTKLYDLGHFDEAIREYEQAYQLKDDPVLLYNIAQTYRIAKNSEQARFYYKSYLRRLPDADNRREVEGKIQELDKLLALETHTQSLPPDHVLQPKAEPTTGEPEPPPTPAPPPPTVAEVAPLAVAPPPPAAGRSKRIAGLVVAGVGVAALAGGIGLGVAAKNAGDSLTAATNSGGTYDPSLQSAGKRDDLIAGVLYGVGAAAVISGVVVAVLGFREKAKPARARLSPSLSPKGAGAALAVEF